MAESGLRADLTEVVSQTEIFKILECPVCMEIPFPPIFMCLRGHSICNVCKPVLAECPICKSNISETRNYVAENIILSSNHACCYKKIGCQIIKRGDLIEDHMTNCKFKNLECPLYMFDNCLTTSLKMSDILQHMNSIHKMSMFPSRPLALVWLEHVSSLSEKIKIENFKHGGGIIEFDGNIFIGALLQKKSVLIWFICLVGTEEEAKKYKGQITVQSINPDNSPSSEFKFNWILPMNSVMNPTHDNFDAGIFKAYYDCDDLMSISPTDNNEKKIFKIRTTYIILKAKSDG